MTRALWKGAISFGLVNIPVDLYPAEDRKAFDFAMLDSRDLSPVGYKRFNKKTGKEVSWEAIVKGFEYQKGRFVVLSDEDFRRANVKATQTIDIQAFVPQVEIPAEYFDSPYFVAPGGKGQKAYALLRETLRATGRVAVAQVVIRTKQHLAAVVAQGRALMLITLRYADELRSSTGLELPAEGLKGAGVTPKEIDLAKRLIDDMTRHWSPAEYKDTYHGDLMARIKEKIAKGETKELTKPDKKTAGEPRSARVIDLAELLRQSLGGNAKRAGPRQVAAAPRARPALRVVPAPPRRTAKAPGQRKRA